jgi:hypothetical protein
VACYSFTVEDFHLLFFGQSPGALAYKITRISLVPWIIEKALTQPPKETIIEEIESQLHANVGKFLVGFEGLREGRCE